MSEVTDFPGLLERLGGVFSQIRTGLHLQFPANREINREFCDFDAFPSDFGTKDPGAAATSQQIPYANQQGKYYKEQGIFCWYQGI
jgi:hypothetical protein